MATQTLLLVHSHTRLSSLSIIFLDRWRRGKKWTSLYIMVLSHELSSYDPLWESLYINKPQIQGRLFAAKMVAEIAPSLQPMTWYELMPGVVWRRCLRDVPVVRSGIGGKERLYQWQGCQEFWKLQGPMKSIRLPHILQATVSRIELLGSTQGSLLWHWRPRPHLGYPWCRQHPGHPGWSGDPFLKHQGMESRLQHLILDQWWPYLRCQTVRIP